jgi:hypothetical protein
MAWVAILVTMVGLLASRFSALQGAAEATRRLCVLSFAWTSAAFGMVLVPGIVSAWQRRGSLSPDLQRSVEFAFALAGLAGLACLAFWAAVHYAANAMPSLLVSWGIVAGLAMAWLGRTDDEWLSRWGILPAAGVAAVSLCALPWLVKLAHEVGGRLAPVWGLATGFLWCALVVGLVFSAFGALVHRARYRAEHRAESLRSDLRLLAACGWTYSASGLAVALALVAARPESVAGLRSVLAGTWVTVGDVLALGLGQGAARALLGAVEALAGRLPDGFGAPLAAGVLAAVLLVHVCAAACWRGALWAMSVMWMLVLGTGVAFAVFYSSRLFMPLPEPELSTAFGRWMQTGFAVRLLLLASIVGLLFRFGEGLVSSLHLARNLARSRRTVLELAATRRERSSSPHLSFLVALGVLLSAAGMGAALLLSVRPDVEAALYETAQLAVRSSQRAAHLGLWVGRLVAQWPGYAVAFGLIAYLLLAAHEEARRRRIHVYPVVGAAWLLLLSRIFVGWVEEAVYMLSPPDPGRTAALVAAGVMIGVFLAATLAVWVRWARLYGTDPDLLEGEEAEPGFAQSLGSVGILVVLAACATVAHGALRMHAVYQESFGRAAARLSALGDRCGALLLSIREALADSGRLQLAAGVTAGVSGCVLILHALARYGVAGTRSVLYGLWVLVALACVAGVGVLVVMFPLGTWSGPMVLGALAALAVAGRALVALARPGDWLEASA